MNKITLTQGDILKILQNSNSVPLGTPIWNSEEEYNKLKAIVECAVAYTHPVKELTLTEDEIDDVWASCSTGESEFIDMHLFAEAILRKAQEK